MLIQLQIMKLQRNKIGWPNVFLKNKKQYSEIHKVAEWGCKQWAALLIIFNSFSGLYANSNNNIIHIWKILRQENGRKISLRERIHNNLCFCPIYGTLYTIPFLLSACITKALLFKHWRPGKESYIYDKGQLLWKSYISRINTAHWHKLKTTNKHDYNSHQTNLLILLPWQAKPSQPPRLCNVKTNLG